MVVFIDDAGEVGDHVMLHGWRLQMTVAGRPHAPAVLRQQLHSKHALELTHLRGDGGATRELRVAPLVPSGQKRDALRIGVDHAPILHCYLPNLALILQTICD